MKTESTARRIAQALFLVAVLAMGLVASAYAAGGLFYLANKTIPHDIGLDTWYRFWEAYREHPVQRGRLLFSGVAAPCLIIGMPLVLHLRHRHRPRPLHGDARWATVEEIRKAGLL